MAYGGAIGLGLPATSRGQGAGGLRFCERASIGGYSALDEMVIEIVRQLQRRFRRGVLPRMAQPWLPEEYWRGEQAIRKRMARLATEGRLKRVGGENARRGYLTVGASPWCWAHTWPAWEPTFKRVGMAA